jgi:hypothetical protein
MTRLDRRLCPQPDTFTKEVDKKKSPLRLDPGEVTENKSRFAGESANGVQEPRGTQGTGNPGTIRTMRAPFLPSNTLEYLLTSTPIRAQTIGQPLDSRIQLRSNRRDAS